MTSGANTILKKATGLIVAVILAFVLLPTLKLKILVSIFLLILRMYIFIKYENIKKSSANFEVTKKKNETGVFATRYFTSGTLGFVALNVIICLFVRYWNPGIASPLVTIYMKAVIGLSIAIVSRIAMNRKQGIPYGNGFRYLLFFYVCVCLSGILVCVTALVREI
jgi:hypothetical protein